MAAHVWTSGESITASKLNALELKKAFAEGTLDLTKYTASQVINLIEEIGVLRDGYSYNSFGYIFYFGEKQYYANSLNDLLIYDNHSGGAVK